MGQRQIAIAVSALVIVPTYQLKATPTFLTPLAKARVSNPIIAIHMRKRNENEEE
jgi:hypothetical protein